MSASQLPALPKHGTITRDRKAAEMAGKFFFFFIFSSAPKKGQRDLNDSPPKTKERYVLRKKNSKAAEIDGRHVCVLYFTRAVERGA